MTLDFTPLDNALGSLGRAIQRAQGALHDEELRDAVIQRFEYTMDLSWKLLQRVLRTVGVQETEIRTKRDLFREAARIGILADPSAWFGYYEARNESSHTYNRVVAQRVYGKAVEFYQDALALLEKMREENDA